MGLSATVTASKLLSVLAPRQGVAVWVRPARARSKVHARMLGAIQPTAQPCSDWPGQARPGEPQTLRPHRALRACRRRAGVRLGRPLEGSLPRRGRGARRARRARGPNRRAEGATFAPRAFQTRRRGRIRSPSPRNDTGHRLGDEARVRATSAASALTSRSLAAASVCQRVRGRPDLFENK